MNKKYMDFVPVSTEKVKKKTNSTTKSAAVSQPKKATVAPNKVIGTAKPEELAARVAEINELEVSEIFEERKVKPRAGVSTGIKESKKADYKPKFVKTEVKKRPLSPNSRKVASKNVYEKKAAPKEEVASGPVTIINKPEKDSRVGLIVTIIITIILGAAAGTVAFLLLPK